MRTTVNVDEQLLAEAKLRAAREHRSISSVIEDALRAHFLDSRQTAVEAERYELPRFHYDSPGLAPGVDLHDKEQMAELLGDNGSPCRLRQPPVGRARRGGSPTRPSPRARISL